jgi:hypothetical protein
MTINAGIGTEISWGEGNWVFLDIGFSEKARSCGLIIGDGTPRCLTFSEAKSAIKSEISKFPQLNLVIEAPLSVCFDAYGNPTGRSIEVEGLQKRYWYVGPGCCVMVASMYLLRELESSAGQCAIRLFEGFVSFKKSKNSRHDDDVEALRNVVRDPVKFESTIYEGNRLKRDESDELLSAFRILGMDCGIPAVINPVVL